MPERTATDWRRRIEDASRASGQLLSADVIDELASHLADLYAAERAAGASHTQALLSADRVLHAATYTELHQTARASSRPSRLDARRPLSATRWLSDLRFDVRYGVRTMGREAVFSLSVIVILAAGIGAATAAWAVMDAVLFRPLPYPSSSSLVVLHHATPTSESGSFAPADWSDYAAQHRHEVTLAAYASWPMNLTNSGPPERLRSVIVSGGFFRIAGSRPILGRVTMDQDDSPSAAPVAVLSHGFWTRRFAANPSVVGKPLVLNGSVVTIVGVMGPEFALPANDVDLWMPVGLSPEVLADRAGEWLSLIGRLGPGVSPQRLQSDLQVTADRLAKEYPQTNAGDRVIVGTLLDDLIGRVRRPLWLGAVAVLFVLLAAGANAANLMLARSSVRHDEIAIRAALGAEPARLARQLVTESALLACVGCLAGVLLSWMFLRTFVVLADGRVPRLDAIHLDARSIVAAVVMTLVTLTVVSAAAVWLLLRTRAGGMSQVNSRATRSVAAAGPLLVSQVAFAIVLIAGTALIARAYASTLRIDPGFDTSSTMTMQLTLPKSGYAENDAQVRFVAHVEEALRHLPGASDVGVVSDLPFVANATHFPVAIEGRDVEPAGLTTVRLADAGFFRALRVPIVGGRSFADADRAGSIPVAIVNRTQADRFGPGSAALGRWIRIEGDGQRTIVGIVGNIRHAGLQADEGAVVYVPYAQKTFAFLNWMGLVVRGPESTLSQTAIRRAVASVDANQPVQAVRSMSDYIADETAPFRFSALVVGSLALAGLLLAATGIYGLASLTLGRRSRELALRMALGATGLRVAVMIVRQTATVLVIGGLIGVLGSLLANRFLEGALPGAGGEGRDIAAALLACVVILIVAVAATFVPALRAARLDPKTALQAE